MKVLFVYGDEPSGHASAALALEAEALSRGARTARVCVAQHYHPVAGRAISRLYLAMVRRAPGFWRGIYDHSLTARAARAARAVYFALEKGRLAETVRGFAPDVVVCTQAATMGVLAQAKARGGFTAPVVAVLTDYGVHGHWAEPLADLYLVPCAETAAALASRGVPRERIRETGIPIDPAYARPPDRAAARRESGLADGEALILLTGGSRGLGPMERIAGSLLERLSGVLVIAACGSDDALRARLAARYVGDRRLRAEAILEPARMRRLLSASDLVVGKAGGLTAAEAMACGVPLLVVEPIPGQEERNAEFLVRRGAAVLAAEPGGAGELAGTLLNDACRLQAMRDSSAMLGVPDSARRSYAGVTLEFANGAPRLI